MFKTNTKNILQTTAASGTINITSVTVEQVCNIFIMIFLVISKVIKYTVGFLQQFIELNNNFYLKFSLLFHI